MPSTDEVTQLLNNQFTVLQYLEGQVEFYKVSLLLLTLINVKSIRVNLVIILMGMFRMEVLYGTMSWQLKYTVL